ncbi:MAG: hypothetical protein GWP91_09515 [Rhodobacterales bacterium]|nr:hypothetical protein [Rhodobacterales bacterium]
MQEEDNIRLVIENGLRVTRILWAAFGFIPLIFGVVLVVTQPQDGALDTRVPILLCVLAFTEVPIMLFMRMRTMGAIGLLAPDDFRTSGFAPVTELQAKFADQRYRVATLISLAFMESITIFGFVCSFLTGSLLWYAAMGLFGCLGILMFVPQKAGFLAQFEPDERSTLRRIMDW